MTQARVLFEQDLEAHLMNDAITGRDGFDPTEPPRGEHRHAVGLVPHSATGSWHTSGSIRTHPDLTLLGEDRLVDGTVDLGHGRPWRIDLLIRDVQGPRDPGPEDLT